jgi:transcriptional regulator with XRE-family HTH domain
MKTLQQFAAALRDRVKQLKLTQESLSAYAGISRQTLAKVLSGRSDFKITTLVALADRLGLEVVLVPKETAPGILWTTEPQTRIQSVVDAAIQAYEITPDARPTATQTKS